MPCTLVIDEGISEETGLRFKSFLQKKKIQTETCIFIARLYPGMPDDRIIIHLLNKNTILLTGDRPFHNKVLGKGLKSYYYNGDGFSPRKLRAIKTGERFHKRDKVLTHAYKPPETEHRSLVMCLSDKQLKRMRTKRRRIRNYFGGLDHMEESAVTISFISKEKKVIIGIRIRVSSNIGIKGLAASENYFEENPSHCPAGIITLFYALFLPLQLMLHHVKTAVYYDSRRISNFPDISGGEIAGLWDMLKKMFKKIDFIPVNKGPLLEQLRTKLIHIKHKKTNEIIPGYFQRVVKNYRNTDVASEN